MDRVADVLRVEDLDLDRRDEPLACPSDVVVRGHGIVVREGDEGQAVPAGPEIEGQRVDGGGGDDVVRIERVDMEVGGPPAPVHQDARLPGIHHPGPGPFG